MACAPRNVAVEVLAQSTAAAMGEDNVKYADYKVSPCPNVHVETEGMTDTRYLCGKGKPKSSQHIQSIRVQIARYYDKVAFDRDSQALERNGYISDARDWKKYEDERNWLTAKIMEQARVVFVTTSSSASAILKHLSPLLNILIIYECECAKAQDFAIPMMALGAALKRMVLPGDPIQLPPLVFSEDTQVIWAKTIFSELIERGFKMTRLNTKYGSHSMLCKTTSELFYQGTVSSYHDTVTKPPPMLTTLTANLPRHHHNRGRTHSESLTSH